MANLEISYLDSLDECGMCRWKSINWSSFWIQRFFFTSLTLRRLLVQSCYGHIARWWNGVEPLLCATRFKVKHLFVCRKQCSILCLLSFFFNCTLFVRNAWAFQNLNSSHFNRDYAMLYLCYSVRQSETSTKKKNPILLWLGLTDSETEMVSGGSQYGATHQWAAII